MGSVVSMDDLQVCIHIVYTHWRMHVHGCMGMDAWARMHVDACGRMRMHVHAWVHGCMHTGRSPPMDLVADVCEEAGYTHARMHACIHAGVGR